MQNVSNELNFSLHAAFSLQTSKGARRKQSVSYQSGPSWPQHGADPFLCAFRAQLCFQKSNTTTETIIRSYTESQHEQEFYLC